MGIIASLLFLIIILALGFVYNNWTLSFIIFFMTGVFAILLAQSNIDEIRKNWNERRCDLEIMVTAHLYKPADDVRTSGEFSAENFNFCVKRVMFDTIKIFLLPIFAMMNQQLDVTESLNEAMNRFRAMQASFLQGFTKILDPVFARFQQTGGQFAVNYQKFLMAMGRVFGITQAILYIGMSLVLTIENFIHFVIRVIMIVMYIILGLMILIFFMIIPVFGIIIYTCQVIGRSPFGYLSKDVCGELCFDPSTNIHLKDGTVKPIGDCFLGDIFEDGTMIEGILHVSGEHEPIFALDGIRVSGAHLVWFEQKQEWIPVAHHPQAQLSLQGCPRLVCLRTSTRNIPLRGTTMQWKFRDWEELPLDMEAADRIWDSLVSVMLNKEGTHQEVPHEIPLLQDTCKVMYKTGEMRKLSELRIGDSIYSSEGFTKITGIYIGKADFSDKELVTDGVWMKGIGETKWHHPYNENSSLKSHVGFHLTTESGCFWIQTTTFSGFVRDFTEVGTKNIALTYNYTRKLLKKSSSREESCVSDSLSQVLLSSLQPIF